MGIGMRAWRVWGVHTANGAAAVAGGTGRRRLRCSEARRCVAGRWGGRWGPWFACIR